MAEGKREQINKPLLLKLFTFIFKLFLFLKNIFIYFLFLIYLTYNNDVMQQFNLNEPHQKIFDQNEAFIGLMTCPVFKTLDMTQVQPDRITN